jgi:hypothetical protein
MVGLKSVWISIFALLLLAACVPQTKQTSCSNNEAYNPALRSCVPTIQDPSAFVNISSYIPTSTYSRYKNDLTPMTFRINISNPYSKAYTTRWLHTFNGSTTDVTGIVTSPTQWDIYPLYFVNEIGNHLLTADVLASNGSILTTHTFEFGINNSPRPYIDTTSVSPNTYAVTLNPTNGNQTYSFNVKNNGSSIPSFTTYSVQWKLYKNGVDTVLHAPNTAVQNFTDISTTGLNSGSVIFDPTTTTGYGLGSFILRARLVYTPANEVVDERQWTITVQAPPLSKISSRALISGSALNPLTNVNVYHAVDYTQATTYNFRPILTDSSPTTALSLSASQANFCVKVLDGEGTYPGDGLGVKVSFLLDGAGAAVYEGITTALNSTICLSDVANTNLAQVIFSNSSGNITQSHTIVARVYDEATGNEYTTSDMASGLSTYPITWNLKVKPQNDVPTVIFGTTASGIACSTNTATVKSGCAILSDTNTIVSIKLNSDDFYVLPAFDETKFNYSVRVYQNNVLLQECSKTLPGQDGLTDVTGQEYQCAFTAPGFNSNGPVDPTTQAYKVVADVSDTQSPVGAYPTTSSSLTWNLVVTEKNTAPVVSLVSGGPVTENSSAAFTLNVTDNERDNFSYQVRYCTNDACTTSASLTPVTTYTRTNGVALAAVPISSFLAEDFLNNVSSVTGCANVDRGLSCTVQFFAVVDDIPSSVTVAASHVVSANAGVVITNYNPAPTFTEASISPLAAVGFSSMVGIPFSISAPFGSAVNDTSIASSEQINRYQWFVKNTTSVIAWTQINGATGPNLIWTPSLINEANVGTDNPIQIKLCVEDRSTGVVPNPLTTASAALCTTGIWETTVRNNVVKIQAPATSMAFAPGDTGKETAVWNDSPSTLNGVTASQAFMAYVDNNNNISVKRTLVQNNGQLVPDTAAYVRTFSALPSGAVSDVRDLSMTGNGNEIYIAYRASSTLAPTSYYAQVRRIDITAGKIAPNINAGKYGFNYTGYVISQSSTPATTFVNGSAAGGAVTITSPGPVSAADTLTINGHVFTYQTAATRTASDLCSDCSASTQAQILRDAINGSTDSLLMGITATAAGTVTTLTGMTGVDYFDGSATFAQVSDDMGDIYITAGRWYLPFINNTVGGANKDKISVASGPTGGNITVAGSQTMTTAAVAPLNGTVALANMATVFNGSFLYVAGISKSGSAMKLYQLDPTAFTISNSSSVMAGVAHTDVEVSASATNVYVASTTLETPVNNMVGVYSSVLGTSEEFKLSNLTNVDAATQNIFNGVSIKSLRLVAYNSEARLVAASDSGVGGVQLFLARIYSNGTNWQVTCKECIHATDSVKRVSDYVRVNVTPVRTKALTSNYTLGSVGATANQNIRNVFMVSMGETDSPATFSHPTLGVFNVEIEQINSSALPVVNENAGLFRPPFFKN